MTPDERRETLAIAAITLGVIVLSVMWILGAR